MESLMQWLQTGPLWQVLLALLVENLLVFFFALGLGQLLLRLYADRRVALPPGPLSRMEAAVAASCVLLNTVVTIVGLFLWRAGLIRYRTDVGLWAFLDVVVLLLVMDLAMYFLHRLAHHPALYPLLHRLHHEYDRPRPLTLFILNPAENLSFGPLWLVVSVLYPASWLGMTGYLTLNVVFGTVGHLGVEPLPRGWARYPVVRCFTGGTFHARHHQDLGCNFGFYTLIWDWLFGTLRKDYWQSFGQVPAWVTDSGPESQMVTMTTGQRSGEREPIVRARGVAETERS
jgi:sterol desaturase/sphingolipid hydroxylase (fatty acid hydroxylase superfamily)